MNIERLIVDNRVLLLGLDQLYRSTIKQYERSTLLNCARKTAVASALEPADVPIEGYYTEDEQLTAYFRWIRSLQTVNQTQASLVADLPEYQRLKQVLESPIFGNKGDGSMLFSGGRDALTRALESLPPTDWSIDNLLTAAHEVALRSDDFSLVALAALAGDAVVLAGLRESVVLYAAMVAGCAAHTVQYEYVWDVDSLLQQRATQFVQEFNQLFEAGLPLPMPENASAFYDAANSANLPGRCVRLGFNDAVSPVQQYHWAIKFVDGSSDLMVEDFWDTAVWTTQRYAQAQGILCFDFGGDDP